MSAELMMWLAPVALAGLLGLFFSARAGIRWTWGVCLQQGLIVAASALGFLVYFQPQIFALGGHDKETAAGLFTGLAWALFFIFNLGQRTVLNKFSLDLSLFRFAQARARLPLMRLLVWGPPAEYWTSMVAIMELYAAGSTMQADELIRQWWHDPRVPFLLQENLLSTQMLGRILQHDWQGIVDLFVKNQDKLSHSQSIIPFQMAMRACAELAEFEKALACIEHASLTANRAATTTIDINFMTFFALAGAVKYLKYVFSLCRDKQALPEFSRLFWLGRCYAARCETRKAIETLEKAKKLTPANMAIWHQRIDKQLQIQQSVEADIEPAQWRAADESIVEKAHQIYTRWRLSSDVVRPARMRPATLTLAIACSVAYVLTNPDMLAPIFAGNERIIADLINLKKLAYGYGELTMTGLNQHQYWRLVTHLFLHGSWAHLLLNTGALLLFGKTVENLYGTPRFLVLFFLSGILSGWAQVFLMPTDGAIGASGAILGIFGAAIAAMIKLKPVVPAPVRKAELKWMVSIVIAQVLFDQLFNNVAAMTDKSPDSVRIAAFAHVGGIIAGFIIGMILPMRKWSEINVDPSKMMNS